MKLEWFREHHRKILYPVAIVVIPGMALFGALSACEQGTLFKMGSSGPEGSFRAGLSVKRVSAAEVLRKRRELWHFGARQKVGKDRATVTSRYALRRMAIAQALRDFGFDVGPDELSDAIRRRVRARAGLSKDEQVTVALYDKMLDNDNLVADRFESLVRDSLTLQRYDQMNLNQIFVGRDQLYLEYCRDHRRVAFCWKEFGSADFLKKVRKEKAPTDAEAEEAHLEAVAEYQKTKKEYDEKYHFKIPLPPYLRNPDRLSAEVLALSLEEVKKTLKPTESELKKHYEKTKFLRPRWWLKKNAADKKKKTAGANKPKYKPFAEVKQEVRKDWLRTVCRKETKSRLKKLAARAVAAEQKAAKENKPFSLAEFAAAHGLQYWRTATATADECKTKGKNKTGAKLFRLVGDHFAELRAQHDGKKKKTGARSFLAPVMYSAAGAKGTKGTEEAAVLRLAEYQPETMKTKEEARAIFKERLLRKRAGEAAKKAALEVRKQWGDETTRPRPPFAGLKQSGWLDQQTAQRERNALALKFFEEQPRLGESIGPVPALLEDKEYRAAAKLSPRAEVRKDRALYGSLPKYMVGFAAAQRVPSFKEFTSDPDWNDKKVRDRIKSAAQGLFMGYGYGQGGRPYRFVGRLERFLVRRADLRMDYETQDPPLFAR